MKRSVVVVQLLVTALFAAVGGFVAVSVGGDGVDADRGGMTAAVPMMTEAQLRAGGASAASDLATTTITPVRILDTREGAAALAGSKEPWGALETRTVAAAGLGTIPADAVGVVVNVTVLNATAPDTFLTLFPTGTTMPNASTINPQPNEVAFNAATVLLGGDDGTFEIYNYTGTVDVIVDVTAYMTRTLADNVDDVSDDVGRLQTGELYVSRHGGIAVTNYQDFFANWSGILGSDDDLDALVYGIELPEDRYSSGAEIRSELVINPPANGSVCFRLATVEGGPILETEICSDSPTAELVTIGSDSFASLVSNKGALNGQTVFFQAVVRPETEGDSVNASIQRWQFRVYDN